MPSNYGELVPKDWVNPARCCRWPTPKGCRRRQPRWRSRCRSRPTPLAGASWPQQILARASPPVRVDWPPLLTRQTRSPRIPSLPLKWHRSRAPRRGSPCRHRSRRHWMPWRRRAWRWAPKAPRKPARAMPRARTIRPANRNRGSGPERQARGAELGSGSEGGRPDFRPQAGVARSGRGGEQSLARPAWRILGARERRQVVDVGQWPQRACQQASLHSCCGRKYQAPGKRFCEPRRRRRCLRHAPAQRARVPGHPLTGTIADTRTSQLQ